MRLTRHVALAVALLCAALFVVACGGPESTATPTPVPTVAPAAATPTPDTMTPSEPAPTSTPLPPGSTPPPATPTPTAAAAVIPTATPIPGFDAEEHFKNKRISVNVGFSPGGGYDTYARVVAKFLPNHLPGNPRFVVRNLTGGGGERIFKPTLVDVEPEGYAVAVVHPRFFKRELVGIDVPDFDMNTVKIVGTASAAAAVSAQFGFRDLGLTWDEAVANAGEIKVGATEPGDSGGLATTFIELVGGPVKNVYGYPGSSDIAAAFDRREIDITTRGAEATAKSLFPEWVENQEIVPLFYWGADPATDQAFTNYVVNDLGAAIPPHIFDIIDLTEEQKTLFNVTETINDKMSRLFVLHPDTPEHIYQVWVDAFRATVHDPEFLEAIALLNRTDVGYGGPEEITRVLQEGVTLLQDPVLREGFLTLAGGVD